MKEIKCELCGNTINYSIEKANNSDDRIAKGINTKIINNKKVICCNTCYNKNN